MVSADVQRYVKINCGMLRYAVIFKFCYFCMFSYMFMNVGLCRGMFEYGCF